MDFMVLFFLSSGLFLGWTLGVNNMCNVFGTAVGTQMLSYKKAIVIASVFVVLGSVLSGQGVSTTLSDLGNITTLPGAFIVALSAAVSLYLVTKTGVPVSSTQAIVGSIIGWSLFAHVRVDVWLVGRIVASWFISPILATVFAFILLHLFKAYLKARPIPMLYRDAYTRAGLVLAGAFSAYALGANNISNVMAPFLDVVHLPPLNFFGITILSNSQLFFIGGVSIAVGIMMYAKDVMQTVGNGLLKMTPIEGLVVVLAHGIVLFLFSSVSLNHFLTRCGLPTIPLVPLSSSGAVVGAILGISLFKRGRGLKVKELVKIMWSWILVPVISALVCFLALFFMENVFGQEVF